MDLRDQGPTPVGMAIVAGRQALDVSFGQKFASAFYVVFAFDGGVFADRQCRKRFKESLLSTKVSPCDFSPLGGRLA
jgi:hypothetical protein